MFVAAFLLARCLLPRTYPCVGVTRSSVRVQYHLYCTVLLYVGTVCTAVQVWIACAGPSFLGVVASAPLRRFSPPARSLAGRLRGTLFWWLLLPHADAYQRARAPFVFCSSLLLHSRSKACPWGLDGGDAASYHASSFTKFRTFVLALP